MSNGNRSHEYYHQLVKKLLLLKNVGNNDMRTNAFCKFESYPLKLALMLMTTKHMRTINAYTDETKILYGPFFSCLEKMFFSLDENPIARFFVKKIPVLERPARMMECFGDGPVNVGDFTSFECHHRGEMAAVVSRALTKMAGDFFDPTLKSMFALHTLAHNVSLFKGTGLKTQIRETLMSGAVWTSLANCLLSFFIVSYLRLRELYPDVKATELRHRLHTLKLYCEGDDTISAGREYDPTIIKSLGIKLKSQVFESCCESEFCGILQSKDSKHIITDPVKAMCNFYTLPVAKDGMRKSKVGGLMRAKAMSFYYQYAGCPVIGKLAYHTLKQTQGLTCDSSALNFRQLEVYQEAEISGPFYSYLCEPDIQTRVLFEQKFKWSVEMQILAEKQIMSGEKVHLPDHLFGDYVDWSARYVDRDKAREVTQWLDCALPDPRIMIGKGVFSVRKFLQVRPQTALEAAWCLRTDKGSKYKLQNLAPMCVPKLVDPFLFSVLFSDHI
jgi:hypothetical protein